MWRGRVRALNALQSKRADVDQAIILPHSKVYLQIYRVEYCGILAPITHETLSAAHVYNVG